MDKSRGQDAELLELECVCGSPGDADNNRCWSSWSGDWDSVCLQALTCLYAAGPCTSPWIARSQCLKVPGPSRCLVHSDAWFIQMHGSPPPPHPCWSWAAPPGVHAHCPHYVDSEGEAQRSQGLSTRTPPATGRAGICNAFSPFLVPLSLGTSRVPGPWLNGVWNKKRKHNSHLKSSQPNLEDSKLLKEKWMIEAIKH